MRFMIHGSLDADRKRLGDLLTFFLFAGPGGTFLESKFNAPATDDEEPTFTIEVDVDQSYLDADIGELERMVAKTGFKLIVGNKERVLEHYPTAYALKLSDGWVIKLRDHGSAVLGRGPKATDAWRNAAEERRV